MLEPETLEKSEADAIEDAVNEVADLLHDGKSLDMIEQHIYRMRRKKEMVETRLKEAVEAQLRGVRTGLFNLQKVMREANDISVSMKEVNGLYRDLNGQLGENAKEIKDTRKVHKEHALLNCYLQNLYNFKDDVKQVHAMLNDDDLLQAHEILMKLEDCRNGIYKEVMNESIEEEKREKVEDFFSGLEELNVEFRQKIHFFLTRALNSIRSCNTWKLVSILRIIEREEKRDALIARELEPLPHVTLPDRPKKWKEEAIRVLSNSVISTIDSVWELNQEDDAWILRFAQKIKGILEVDLRVVDQHLQQCFPPSWDILEFFCSAYQANIRLRFEEIIRQIQSTQAQASSYTIVYHWTTILNNILKPYRSREKHEGILTPSHINTLVCMYTDKLDFELSRQTERILRLERDGRYELNKSPEGANLEPPHYHTTTPVLFYEMINQNLDFAFKLESKMDLIPVLSKLDSKITFFIDTYVADLGEFREKYFTVPAEDKEDMHYVEWLIAAANNAVKAASLNSELVATLQSKGDKDIISGNSLMVKEQVIENKTELYKTRMMQIIFEFLSELVFSDLKTILPKLYTAEWQEKKCWMLAKATIEDYNTSFFQLIDPPGNADVIKVVADQLLVEYLVTLFNTKSLNISMDEFRDNLLGDHEKITSFFERVLKTGDEFPHADYECLKAVAALVSETEDMIHMEMADFVNKYPDVMYDQCVALLALRGDMNREGIKDMVSSNGILETPEHSTIATQTIFSKVHLVTGPLSSRFFQTVVAPRAAGFRAQTASALNTSVTSATGTSFSKFSTVISNSPVYHAINQAWNEKDQLSSKAVRALDFSGSDLPERTNPFSGTNERINPFDDVREGKGPAPRPPPKKKGPAPVPPGRKPRSASALSAESATKPRSESTVSTNPFEFDDD